MGDVKDRWEEYRKQVKIDELPYRLRQSIEEAYFNGAIATYNTIMRSVPDSERKALLYDLVNDVREHQRRVDSTRVMSDVLRLVKGSKN